jgi:hypothetical protein
MSATELAARPAVTAGQTVGQLGWLYAKRFARHPLFLLGVLLCAWAFLMTGDDTEERYSGLTLAVALFIGITSMVVAHRLTKMTDGAAEVADAAPTSGADAQRRSVAVLFRAHGCRGCLLCPDMVRGRDVGTAGLDLRGFRRWQLARGVLRPDGHCPFGAAALGIAAGRWLRFPGAIVLLVVSVLGWVFLSLSLVATNDVERFTSTGANALRPLSPFTFWTTLAMAEEQVTGMTSFPGSPIWYAAWQLVLCALAATAALLWRADGSKRRTLMRTGAVLMVCAVATYVLALTVNSDGGGLYRPDGTVERASEQ